MNWIGKQGARVLDAKRIESPGMKSRAVCLLLFAALLGACNEKSEIKVYRIARPQGGAADVSAGEAAPPMENMPMPGSMTAGTVPPSWEKQPLAQMRQASFLVKGENGKMADISLVRLSGGAGGTLDNVNRWLSQLGQPATSEEKLGQMAQHLTTSMGDVTVVDLKGLPAGAEAAKDGRIIAAMTPANGSTLFFKMRGNAELVETQKADFVKWVASVCNAETETKAPPTAAAPAMEKSDGAQIKWKLPEGWKQIPASSMRYASFNAAGSNGEVADISVVTFPGEGGDDAANVNRWRQQIGLPPLDAAAVSSAITPLKAGQTSFSTVDMTGGDKRMLAAWTRHEGQSWFFKITGPSALVEREKTHFSDFVRSVQFLL